VGKGAKRRAHQTAPANKQMSRYPPRQNRRRDVLLHRHFGGPFQRTSDQRNRSPAPVPTRRCKSAFPLERLRSASSPINLHALWQLPDGDADFASRWSLFKSSFSRGLQRPRHVPQAKSRNAKEAFGQRRYWERAIRDDADFERHVDYIHYNPVKHGFGQARCRLAV